MEELAQVYSRALFEAARDKRRLVEEALSELDFSGISSDAQSN